MKITVLDGYTLNPGDNAWDAVARLGSFTCHDRTPAALIVERARDAEIVLTNKTPLSAETLAQLPALKYIGVLATGYNVVDTAAAAARGIPVANVPAYGTDAVAEHVFALLLNHTRQVRLHSDLVKSGEWSRGPDWTFWKTPLVELAGQTIGIVGFGRIGRRVGEIAAAFRMNVLANATHESNPPAYPFQWANKDEIFTRSDVVTLHCPLTPENTGMVNRALLARMKPTALLINTSRGPLVNEADLAEALAEKQIAGAAIDVVSKEPIAPDNPLLKAPDITITPHLAWATLAARQRLMKVSGDNIAAFLAGQPINVVNAPAQARP
ncbi:MAG: D-isomer specific 2-hydroxyacid dehydrogenase NAD-binding [Verrucomicrobia bacterium]|nr:D-isomer specific 2-hydroxyacid dehydrogenase NAD-binding [Verrucomicrobiota bacterium]